MSFKNTLGIFLWCLFFYSQSTAQSDSLLGFNKDTLFQNSTLIYTSQEMKRLDSLHLSFINDHCTIYHSDTTIFLDNITPVSDSIFKYQVEFLDLHYCQML